MDVAKAFTYVFDDERWVGKIGIGAIISLLTFLIVPIFLLSGWAVGVTRNVMNNKSDPMPEWDDWGTLLRDGFAIFIATIVYTLPFWLIVCIAAVATLGFGGMSEMNQDVAAAGLFATFGLLFCLTAVFMLALFFISPAIMIQYVRTNDLAACFRFGEVIALTRENIGDIFIAALAPFLISLVLSTVLGVVSAVPVIGWCGGPILGMAVGPYLSASVGHLYGQIAAKIGGNKEMKFAQ